MTHIPAAKTLTVSDVLDDLTARAVREQDADVYGALQVVRQHLPDSAARQPAERGIAAACRMPISEPADAGSTCGNRAKQRSRIPHHRAPRSP